MTGKQDESRLAWIIKDSGSDSGEKSGDIASAGTLLAMERNRIKR